MLAAPGFLAAADRARVGRRRPARPGGLLGLRLRFRLRLRFGCRRRFGFRLRLGLRLWFGQYRRSCVQFASPRVLWWRRKDVLDLFRHLVLALLPFGIFALFVGSFPCLLFVPPHARAVAVAGGAPAGVESAVDKRRPGDIQIPQPMETPEDQDRNECGERVPRHASRQCAADADWRRLLSFQLRPPRRATHRAPLRWATQRLSLLASRERSLTCGTRPQTGHAKFRRSHRLRAASTLTLRRRWTGLEARTQSQLRATPCSSRRVTDVSALRGRHFPIRA
mmetsp:Transcript_8072/g.22647  ORF Transcript_8072/g.22647 Transcript_8072/m.22647 type:complete len:280 (+) Transcript_8072:331-1170(+)